ncbi:hypothetical protein [Nonlabens agnitus]|uniref:Cell wall anchor protein n=1 Tax=Nonlabens agnitus TaxID=870484 RepID=A0A2S9WS98_9FLAO|nr:hypothetical protein [Nonlabens agnitus]PRP66354.1 hypothetical protein BST86_04245 [Nonlabens agnitus]
MKYFTFIIISFFSVFAFSQVGIGTAMPESSLDIRAANHLGNVSASDGVLVPRVNDLSTAGATDGQLVYLTEDVSTFTKGFHYWDDALSAWTPINSTIEPWNRAGTNNPATLNTDNIYTQGQVGIGTDNPLGALHITTQNSRDVLLFRFIDSPGDDLDIDLLRARGTASSPALLQDNTRLGGLRGQSFTGSSTIFNPSAEIWFQTEGASSPTSSAAEINFATTPVGALSTIERMTIKSDGKVGIGTDAPASTLEVTGQPTNTAVLDGMIPPRLTGNQLQAKTYTAAQNGAIVYATSAATAPAGQTINVTSEGLYVFSSSQNRWNLLNSGSLNVGQRTSVYRRVTLADNEYLSNTGLIELEGLIRVTVQRDNAVVYRPQIINISGSPIEVTLSGNTLGATVQRDYDTNLILPAGGFVSPDPDGITYWDVRSETVTSQIALPN